MLISNELLTAFRSFVQGQEADHLWKDLSTQGIETRPGQIIYTEQDPTDDVYLLTEGVCIVRVRDCWPQVRLILKAPCLWGDVELQSQISTRGSQLESFQISRLFRFSEDIFHDACEDTLFYQWHKQDLSLRTHKLLLGGGAQFQTLEAQISALQHCLGEEFANDEEAVSNLLSVNIKSVLRARKNIQKFISRELAAAWNHQSRIPTER